MLVFTFFILSFVTGSSFPKPLSIEDEKKYILQFESGTEEEKQEAKNILIEHNLRLVAHIAKKYNGFQKEQEDFMSLFEKYTGQFKLNMREIPERGGTIT